MEISKKNILLVNDDHLMEMNSIIQLKNWDIISGSVDKNIKIWDLRVFVNLI